MKLDLFSKDDSVLLLGEGNFSFSVCLVKHKLPIGVVATCFEGEVSYEGQQENIEYLISQNVPVLFNVDATKLHENVDFRGRKFSKVVFNFPHVGGKMKIQLNRDLLRKFFQSVPSVLADDSGLVVVSLCQGQGGTPADEPRRKWSDSWQITEMAGSGGFALIEVVPFSKEFFNEYSCIGYRSQDVKFNLDGALVHVFVRKGLPFENLNWNDCGDRLNLVPIDTNQNLLAPVVYSEMYAKNLFSNPKTSVSFIRDVLLSNISKVFPNRSVKVCTDREVPLQMSGDTWNGISSCEHKLRRTPFDILDTVLESYTTDNIIFHSGMYFPVIKGKSFLEKPPVNLVFLIMGEKVSRVIAELITVLFEVFQVKNFKCESESVSDTVCEGSGKYSVIEKTRLFCRKEETTFSLGAAYCLRYGESVVDACILSAEDIGKLLLNATSWKEVWAGETVKSVETGGKPISRPGIIFPSSYKFDITLRYDRNGSFSEDTFYELLWLGGGNLIEDVEFVSEFDSESGWSSKCYRITYKSWDQAMCREHAVKIHEKLMAPVLKLGMNVTIG